MARVNTGRSSNRKNDQLRKVTIEKDVNMHAEGSVIISMGNTKVLCTASVEEKVPPFLRGKNSGWVSAEYSMLPRATNTRNVRESARGKLGGRTMEIQRLIARALRAVVNLKELGERAIMVDCDVLQADGGTRTASITGGFVAMMIAMQKLVDDGALTKLPVTDFLAAVSVGVVKGSPMLDLDYSEDSTAGTDMNVVMTSKGKFVELQGTAEDAPFTKDELDALIELASEGIKKLIREQKKILKK